MARIVQCVVLGRAAEGLTYAPYPGDLGKRIYNQCRISLFEDQAIS